MTTTLSTRPATHTPPLLSPTAHATTVGWLIGTVAATVTLTAGAIATFTALAVHVDILGALLQPMSAEVALPLTCCAASGIVSIWALSNLVAVIRVVIAWWHASRGDRRALHHLQRTRRLPVIARRLLTRISVGAVVSMAVVTTPAFAATTTDDSLPDNLGWGSPAPVATASPTTTATPSAPPTTTPPPAATPSTSTPVPDTPATSTPVDAVNNALDDPVEETHGSDAATQATSTLITTSIPTTPQPTTYVVAAGDCLWSIAANLASTDDPVTVDHTWREIYAANRSTIGADPNVISIGMTLTIPNTVSAPH